jgi:hypothetical protein
MRQRRRPWSSTGPRDSGRYRAQAVVPSKSQTFGAEGQTASHGCNGQSHQRQQLLCRNASLSGQLVEQRVLSRNLFDLCRQQSTKSASCSDDQDSVEVGRQAQVLEYAVRHEEVRHMVSNEIKTLLNREFEGYDPKADCGSCKDCRVVLVGEFAGS